METIFDREGRRIFLSLGSNLGDREAHLCDAIERLKTRGLTIVAASSVYETAPLGYEEQDDFLNQVIEVRFTGPFPTGTEVSVARELLRAVLKIEDAMGRRRTFRNAPRLIDIDLLLFGDLRLASADLIVPHPRLTERRFVLEPLNEIAPEVIDPSSKKTIAQLLVDCADDSAVRVYKEI